MSKRSGLIAWNNAHGLPMDDECKLLTKCVNRKGKDNE